MGKCIKCFNQHLTCNLPFKEFIRYLIIIGFGLLVVSRFLVFFYVIGLNEEKSTYFQKNKNRAGVLINLDVEQILNPNDERFFQSIFK